MATRQIEDKNDTHSMHTSCNLFFTPLISTTRVHSGNEAAEK